MSQFKTIIEPVQVQEWWNRFTSPPRRARRLDPRGALQTILSCQRRGHHRLPHRLGTGADVVGTVGAMIRGRVVRRGELVLHFEKAVRDITGFRTSSPRTRGAPPSASSSRSP